MCIVVCLVICIVVCCDWCVKHKFPNVFVISDLLFVCAKMFVNFRVVKTLCVVVYVVAVVCSVRVVFVV